MGQIAEDMLDGSCCQLCGCYFNFAGNEMDGVEQDGIYCHDEPVVCFDCWKDLTDDEREGYIKADVETF